MTGQVLIVEDDADVRETLAVLLRGEGLGVMTATDGADALTQLRACGTLPRLILLDVMMPVLDGRSFRAAQLQDPRLRAIPTVVLTADAHAASKASEMGAHGALQKPVDLDVLLAEVARHIQAAP